MLGLGNGLSKGIAEGGSPAVRGGFTNEYSVDFNEPRFPLTAQEEREQWSWEWQNGLSSKKDWFRKYNPDLMEDEIDSLVEELAPEETPAAESPSPGNMLLEALES